jgi:hypothetical protein
MTFRRILLWLSLLGVTGGILFSLHAASFDPPPGAPEGWRTAAPRQEIRPEFAYDPAGGCDGKGCFIIRADAREGLDGSWTKTIPVVGGRS